MLNNCTMFCSVRLKLSMVFCSLLFSWPYNTYYDLVLRQVERMAEFKVSTHTLLSERIACRFSWSNTLYLKLFTQAWWTSFMYVFYIYKYIESPFDCVHIRNVVHPTVVICVVCPFDLFVFSSIRLLAHSFSFDLQQNRLNQYENRQRRPNESNERIKKKHCSYLYLKGIFTLILKMLLRLSHSISIEWCVFGVLFH